MSKDVNNVFRVSNLKFQSITFANKNYLWSILSAGLFTLYTSDKESTNDRCIIIKYADDTVIICLLTDKDNSDDNCEFKVITSFAQGC